MADFTDGPVYSGNTVKPSNHVRAKFNMKTFWIQNIKKMHIYNYVKIHHYREHFQESFSMSQSRGQLEGKSKSSLPNTALSFYRLYMCVGVEM